MTYELKTGEQILIKEATEKDAQRIIDYCRIVGGESDYLSFGAGEFNKSVAEEEQVLVTYKNADNQLFIYAELDGKVIGLLDVSASKKDRIKHSGEFGITVFKKHWGKGIATLLIDYMINWAKTTGVIKKLNLKVLANNEKAIILYRKFNFSMEGRLTKEFFVNGEYIDMISMGYWIEE